MSPRADYRSIAHAIAEGRALGYWSAANGNKLAETEGLHGMSLQGIVLSAVPAVGAGYAFHQGGSTRKFAYAYLALIGLRFALGIRRYATPDRAAEYALNPRNWTRWNFRHPLD